MSRLGRVVSQSGLHLHHLVFGITMMMAAGVISFALLGTGWWYEVCAFVFGVGMGLTIDEFALWIYLDDVYWSREGRSSIDASVIALGFMGLILLGGFSVNFGASTPVSVLATVPPPRGLDAATETADLTNRQRPSVDSAPTAQPGVPRSASET